MPKQEKFDMTKQKAEELGWNVRVNENHAVFSKELSNGKTVGFEFDFEDCADFATMTDVRALEYWNKSADAQNIREVVTKFRDEYVPQDFHTVDELCDVLEEYEMTLRQDDDRYYFLRVNRGMDHYLYRFKIEDGPYICTEATDRAIKKIINFILRFNSERFAYVYIFDTKEQKQRLKNIYEATNEAGEAFHSLFNAVDDIRFAPDEDYKPLSRSEEISQIADLLGISPEDIHPV